MPTDANLTPALTINQGTAIHPLDAFQAADPPREDLPQREPARYRDARGTLPIVSYRPCMMAIVTYS